MHTGTQRPDADGPQITFLRAYPVDESTAEEVANGINDGKDGGYATVVGIRPVKLRCNEVLPCEGKHLTVHVIDGGGKEEHATYYPSVICLLRFLVHNS